MGSILPLSPARRWAVTAGIMTGMFLAALEATVVATAMPTVIAALGGMSHYSWVFSAYLLASTVTVPLWGKLSDLYGRRVLYQVGVIVFLIGSVLSGFSTTMTQLIIFRALQGIGAGALVPLGMTIVGEIFTLEERARMQGLFSGVWGLASIIGPLAGGFITDSLSWRWVFFINVPFGIASALIIRMSLTQPERHGRPKIDLAGAFTLTASMTMLMLALVDGGSIAKLILPRNLLLFAGAILFLVAFVIVERRAEEPIVPLQLFRNRVVTVAVIVGFLAGVAMFGAITFVPLFAQGARGDSATAAGSLLTPLMLSWVSMSIIGGRLLLRVGYRPMVLAGLLFMSTAFVVFSFFDALTPRWMLMADLALLGAGLGLTMLTLLLAVQHSVPRSQLGISTSLNQFSRSIGGAIGVAFLGALLSASLLTNLTDAARSSGGVLSETEARRLAANPSALIETGAHPGVTPAVLNILRAELADSTRGVFIAGALLSFLALLIALFRLPGDRPERARESRAEESMAMAELATLDPKSERVAER
jgi:EmrB/QacA subfamily drug resistance transporter